MEEEKKADLDAVEMLQDASGGIHYFDTIAKHNILVRQQNLASTQSFDAQGNNLNDINHPPLTERVDYLRRWQIEHSSRSNFS